MMSTHLPALHLPDRRPDSVRSEVMPRPRVTIYNEISLDGRIEGFHSDVGRYYRLGFRWRSNAILMGSVTAQAFGPTEPANQQLRKVPAPERLPVVPGFEDLVYEPRPILVVPDSRGRVRNWVHALAQPWYGAIVVLTSRATPPGYIEYLNRRGIEHLSAGEDRIDLGAALEQLQARYGVQSIRTDCGGHLNGALLTAGLVDEVAVIINPTLAANPKSQSFVTLPHAVSAVGLPLTLREVDRLNDGAIWLRYDVQRHGG
jgi:2,5-diamino-6-(ribosylamino)-4(3H)-pyrimidinone 5'-phosphate reductase